MSTETNETIVLVYGAGASGLDVIRDASSDFTLRDVPAFPGRLVATMEERGYPRLGDSWLVALEGHVVDDSDLDADASVIAYSRVARDEWDRSLGY